MNDWIHCSICFSRPGSKSGKFYLASCGEIFCQQCFSECGDSVCKVCKQSMQVLEVNRQLKPDLQLFFLTPKEVVKRHNKQLFKIMEFQARHRSQEQKMRHDQLKKVEKLMEYFRDEMKKKAELEKNLNSLKDEYKRLYEETKNLQEEYARLAEEYRMLKGDERRRKRARTPSFANAGTANDQFGSDVLFGEFGSNRNNSAAVLKHTPSNASITATPKMLSVGRITMALKGGRNSGSGGLRKANASVNSTSSPVPSVTTPVILGISTSSAKVSLSRNPYDGVWKNSGNSPLSFSPRKNASRSAFGTAGTQQPPIRNDAAPFVHPCYEDLTQRCGASQVIISPTCYGPKMFRRP